MILLYLTACFRGGPPDGHVPAVLDGSTAGTGTTDTGSVALGTFGLQGEGQLRGSGEAQRYEGTETAWFKDAAGATVCEIQSLVSSLPLQVPPCESCLWAFTLQSAAAEATGCEGVDLAGWQDQRFHYGYAEGDGYGILAYYYGGYGWYGTSAEVSLSGGELQYLWPLGYFSE